MIKIFPQYLHCISIQKKTYHLEIIFTIHLSVIFLGMVYYWFYHITIFWYKIPIIYH